MRDVWKLALRTAKYDKIQNKQRKMYVLELKLSIRVILKSFRPPWLTYDVPIYNMKVNLSI